MVARIVELKCRCGEVQGKLTGVSPGAFNHAVCYCDDCQAYLHHLGRADLLDGNGGSDIIQVAPATLTFQRGVERIVGLRLTPKGLHRWYASCCNTPVGNTLTPVLPFVGLLVPAFSSAASADGPLGKPEGAMFGKFATGTPPAGATKIDVRLLLRSVGRVIKWGLAGRAWPNPFFDRATGMPTRPLTVLSRAEREALRPLCGPQPLAAKSPAL